MDIALVHGAYHGAWCWELLRPELERLGHRAIAMDLPISDPSLGAADYAITVEGALDAIPNPAGELVLVGHSMGGLVVPLVAARRPLHRLIFLAAFLPAPGRSANQQREEEAIDARVEPTSSEFTDLGEDVWMVGPRTAKEIFYHDVRPRIARWATDRLRAQCYRTMSEITPLEAWPDVECRSIVCADDHTIDPGWVRAAARKRLGVKAVELPGGHSPFLSRPAELARSINAML